MKTPLKGVFILRPVFDIIRIHLRVLKPTTNLSGIQDRQGKVENRLASRAWKGDASFGYIRR